MLLKCSWKLMNCIQHVCRTGRAEFKMEMTRKVDPLKECLRKLPPLIPHALAHFSLSLQSSVVRLTR